MGKKKRSKHASWITKREVIMTDYGKPTLHVGDVFTNNQGIQWTIVDYKNSLKVTIKSSYSDTVKQTNTSCIRRGTVKDPYFPEVAGIGYMGEGTHASQVEQDGRQVKNKTHKVWQSMLTRCYKPTEKFRTYADCSVVEEWHNFQNFAEWYEARKFEACYLDKDIKVFGNRVYGPETCLLVPCIANNFILDNTADRGACVLGVTYQATRGNTLPLVGMPSPGNK